MKKLRLQDIPEEFGYLREATRRYGHLSHHEVILEFLENKTEADLQFFRDVAAEIESHNHWRDIDRWLRDAQENDLRVAYAVTAMMSLMAELGIPEPVDYTAMPREEARTKLAAQWKEVDSYGYSWLAETSKLVFTDEEARAFAVKAFRQAPRKEKLHALLALQTFPVQANVRLIERYWRNRQREARPPSTWGTVAAVSGIDWPTLRDWLARGGPLRKIAISALMTFGFDYHVPTTCTRPTLAGASSHAEIRMFLDQLAVNLDDPIEQRRLAKVLPGVDAILLESNK